MQFPEAKHDAHMCGGMKALKQKGVRSTLWLAYHGWAHM